MIHEGKECYGVVYRYSHKDTTVSDKGYIGQTTDLKARCKMYEQLRCEGQPKWFKALAEYGYAAFERKIIATAQSKEELDTLEQYYIQKYDSIKNGYNCMAGGAHGKHSDDTKKLLGMRSAAWWADPEVRARQSELNRQAWEDPERRARQRKMTLALWNNPTYRENQIVSAVVNWLDPEYREKVTVAITAACNTPEARARRSELSSNAWLDPEYRAKQSESRKKVWAIRKAKQQEQQQERQSA